MQVKMLNQKNENYLDNIEGRKCSVMQGFNDKTFLMKIIPT